MTRMFILAVVFEFQRATLKTQGYLAYRQTCIALADRICRQPCYVDIALPQDRCLKGRCTDSYRTCDDYKKNSLESYPEYPHIMTEVDLSESAGEYATEHTQFVRFQWATLDEKRL